MDEPFGTLDEMTRERLNAEVLRIWQATGTTVIFVTHSIPEAVFLSTRVVVMSPRPGRITHEIEIDLAQPRNDQTRETDRYFELVTEVRESLRGRRGVPNSGEGEDGARGGVGRAHARRRRDRLSGARAQHVTSVYMPPVVVLVAVLLLWQLASGSGGRQVIPPPRRSSMRA